ncbi:MAG: hypothetical protein AB9919_14950 [Geobacteraceae bacterium]
MKSLSEKIAGFLTNLPHFQSDKQEGKYVAVRLTDGSVFAPQSDEEDNGNGILTVYWQGDLTRKTTVTGASIASVEIVEACRYWVATGIHKDLQETVQFMFEHYQFKTGQNLYCDTGEDDFIPKFMQPFFKDIGLEVIKKFVGL